MLSGCKNEAQIGCIFTGKRGYTNWTGDTGYFVPDSDSSIVYMGVYVANVTAIEALKELLGISEPESQKPIPALRDELENDDGENDDGMPSEKPQNASTR